MKTIIYSATAWWQDSDPTIQIIGFDSKVVKEKILEAMANDEQTAIEESEPDFPFEDSMCWSGVCPFGIKEFFRSLHDYERRDVIENLRTNGFSFVTSF